MSDGNILKETVEVVDRLQQRWEERSTPLIILLIALGVFIWLSPWSDSFYTGLAKSLIAVLFLAIVEIYWFWSTRLPITPDGKIGLVIAIRCESAKERLRLKSDFAHALREEISKNNPSLFHVFEASEYQSNQVLDHVQAVEYLRQTRSHLLIWGQCRRRLHNGEPTYVLDLSESVRHAPVPKEVSFLLGQDMRMAFPQKVLIPEKHEALGFSVTGDIVTIAAQFTLGIASLISGDPITAFDLHESVWREAKQLAEKGDDQADSYQMLQYRCANLLVLSGLNALRMYYLQKPDGFLGPMKRYLDRVQEIDPGNYSAHLLKGTYLFLKDDIDGAKKEIKLAKNDRNAQWQYSLAFLEAYEGNLEQAHKIYKRAFKGSVPDVTPLEVEMFMCDVLDKQPEKIQLSYCLGLVNYFVKHDLTSAMRDFQTFIEKATEGNTFSPSVIFAKQYLAEIQASLEGEAE